MHFIEVYGGTRDNPHNIKTSAENLFSLLRRSYSLAEMKPNGQGTGEKVSNKPSWLSSIALHRRGVREKEVFRIARGSSKRLPAAGFAKTKVGIETKQTDQARRRSSGVDQDQDSDMLVTR